MRQAGWLRQLRKWGALSAADRALGSGVGAAAAPADCVLVLHDVLEDRLEHQVALPEARVPPRLCSSAPPTLFVLVAVSPHSCGAGGSALIEPFPPVLTLPAALCAAKEGKGSAGSKQPSAWSYVTDTPPPPRPALPLHSGAARTSDASLAAVIFALTCGTGEAGEFLELSPSPSDRSGKSRRRRAGVRLSCGRHAVADRRAEAAPTWAGVMAGRQPRKVPSAGS